MISSIIRFRESLLFKDTRRFHAYVLSKAGFTVVALFLLWALKDMDVVVVYMKF